MSGKVYYSYRNGTYELAKTNAIFQERSPYGPAPLEEVLKLIEDINADPVQNPHWQRDVANRLNQKHFRCTQILTAPRNEMGMSKRAYLFSKISSHPKLVISAITIAVLAPGYLVKNHPALALYLGLPTLRETANTIKDWFTTTRFSSDFFLDITRKSLSNSQCFLSTCIRKEIQGNLFQFQEKLSTAKLSTAKRNWIWHYLI